MQASNANGARKELPTPDQVSRKTEHYPAEVHVPIRKFHRIMIEEGWTLAQACERVPHGPRSQPISTATLSQLLNGEYPSPKAVSQSVQRAVKLYDERRLLENIGFVETRLSKTIFTYCKWAHANQRVVRIYGRTHDGKSTALEAFPHVYKTGQPLYWRLPASASYLVAVTELCKALGYFNIKSNRAAREVIFSTITDSHLLLVDELHLAFTTYARGQGKKLVELLREIHDRCKCGQVLCGTEALSNSIQKGEDELLFRQMVQRSPTCLDTTPTGKMKQFLPGYGKGGKEDVERIAQSFGLNFPDPETLEVIREIVKGDSTGRLFHLLTGAKNRARNLGEEIDWNHFHATREQLNRYAYAA